MKNSLLVLLAALSSCSLSQASTPVRAECEQWQAKATAIVDFQSQQKTLLPGKTIKDLVGILAAYPDEASFTLERTSKKSKDIIDGYLARPGCHGMTYWSLHRWIQTDPAFDLKTRRTILRELVDRTVREEAGEPSLISLVQRVQLFEEAVRQGVLEVEDPAYFALSRLVTETDQLRAEATQSFANTVPESCLDEQTLKTRNHCSERTYDRLFEHYVREHRLTTALRRELVRWVRRVDVKEG
jgi:hypothetical protein